MSDVNPDVHADFDEMVTIQLARKDARIRELEAELQQARSMTETSLRPTGQQVPDALQPPPALILPPSVTWRRSDTNPRPAEGTVPETPGREEEIGTESRNMPAIAPPASPYGWDDPVISQHFG